MKDIRDTILNDWLIHEPECAASLYDEACDCIQQNVADNIAEVITNHNKSLLDRVESDLELDKILTDDFNPWFPGSEYGKDALDEAKEKIRRLVSRKEEDKCSWCGQQLGDRTHEACIEASKQSILKG